MAITFTSTKSLSNTGTAPVTAHPCTIAARFKISSLTGGGRIGMVGTSGGTLNGWMLQYAGTGNLQATSYAAGLSSSATSTNAFTTGGWHYGAAVFTASNSRAVYLDGTKTTNASSRNPTGMDEVHISYPTTGATGDIAEFAVYNVAWTDADAAAHAAGVPLQEIRPEGLVFYCKVHGVNSPETDIVGGRAMTWNGSPVAAAHPPVIYPKRKHRTGRPAYVPSAQTWPTMADSPIGRYPIGMAPIVSIKTDFVSYEIVAEGGFSFAGSADVAIGYAPPVSGGLSLAGTAGAPIQGYVPSPSGGLSFVGTADPPVQGYVPPVAGGLTLGGTADSPVQGYVPSVSGGLVFAGSADPPVQSYAFTPSGGITLAGTGSIAIGYTPPVSGGMTFAGVAGTEAGFEVSTAGGISLAGAGSVLVGFVPPVAGGITLAGAASVGVGYAPPSGGGGLTFAGEADVSASVGIEIVGSGGFTFGGTAPPILTVSIIPTGGFVFGGEAGVETVEINIPGCLVVSFEFVGVVYPALESIGLVDVREEAIGTVEPTLESIGAVSVGLERIGEVEVSFEECD